MKIGSAKTDEEIQSCYAVMSELRPHIAFEYFMPRVKRQIENYNFQLAYLFDDEVKAVGGFRIAEWLSGGKYLEIEDLATKSGERSKGYNGKLFDWLADFAEAENCNQRRLVSHVKRFDAHRFYLNKRMIIEAHYFSMNLNSEDI